MGLDPKRTVAELKELRELTGDENGRTAGRLDGDVGASARVAPRPRREHGRRGVDRRGRQPVVHARRRVGACRSRRRAHRLGAERRLARRLPERRRRRRGAAPCGRGRHSACDASDSSTGPTRKARASGGVSSARAPQPARWRIKTSFVNSPTAMEHASRMRSRRTTSISTQPSTRARSSTRRLPTSSCTSSRGRCSSRSGSPSAWSSERSASSATGSRGTVRQLTPARRRWTSAETHLPVRRSSRSRFARLPDVPAVGRCARQEASSASPGS